MARFPVPFGKRKSAVPKEDGDVVPSFRVLERTDPVGVKSFDDPRGARRPVSTVRPHSQVDNLAAEEENMFAHLNGNRYVIFLSGLVRRHGMYILEQITTVTRALTLNLPASPPLTFASHLAGIC